MKTTAYVVVGAGRYGYWGSTGKDWVDNLKEAKFYVSVHNAEKAIKDHQTSYKKTPGWHDNAIWEVTIETEKIVGLYIDGAKTDGN